MKKIVFFVLIVFALILVTGCTYKMRIFEGDGIKDTRVLENITKTESYGLEINNINLKDDSIRIKVIEGETPSISIKTDQNVLNDLSINIENNLIKIVGNKKYRYDVEDFLIEITNVKLNKLNLVGAFNLDDEIGNYDTVLNINIDGVLNTDMNVEKVTEEVIINLNGVFNADFKKISTNKVKLDLNGTMNVEASGSAKNLEVDANGVINLELKDLVVEEAKISMDGLNDASFYVTNELNLDIDGLGNVYYYGDPVKAKIDKDGLVNVTKK